MSAAAVQSEESIDFGVHRLAVWPERQKVSNWRDTGILVTEFADHALYAPALRAAALEREDDPKFTQRFPQHLGLGSAKIFAIDKWPQAAAALIHARALAFFKRATGSRSVAVDLCWASVYRDGDLCLPHSHPRTLASVLYALDLGETGENNGQFYFADPRLAPCCREEEGYMSTPGAPAIKPGTMILFPGKAVHFVTPYRGAVPRLTMSWNLNREARAGKPLPEGAPSGT